jgi:hypothetical protein
VDPVPDPLLLRKIGSAENRTRTSGSVASTTEEVTSFNSRTRKELGEISSPINPHDKRCLTEHQATKVYIEVEEHSTVFYLGISWR